MDDSLGIFVRTTAFGAALLVIVFFLYRVVRAWRYYSWGQKFLAIGILGYMIYVQDALREAIDVHVGWRWRLVPLCVGLVAFVFYVAEPMTLSRNRWGTDPLKKKDSE